jgi:hypothetical protein
VGNPRHIHLMCHAFLAKDRGECDEGLQMRNSESMSEPSRCPAISTGSIHCCARYPFSVYVASLLLMFLVGSVPTRTFHTAAAPRLPYRWLNQLGGYCRRQSVAARVA